MALICFFGLGLFTEIDTLINIPYEELLRDHANNFWFVIRWFNCNNPN